MKRFHGIEKNGNGVLCISQDNEIEAQKYLEETLKEPEGWFIEQVDEGVE